MQSGNGSLGSLPSKYFRHAEDILWIDLEDILEKTQPCIKCAIKPIKI